MHCLCTMKSFEYCSNCLLWCLGLKESDIHRMHIHAAVSRTFDVHKQQCMDPESS